MMWYWYFSGMTTVLFVQSLLFNYAQYKGWVKFTGRTKRVVHKLYDQDNSGSYKRVIQ